MTKKAKDIYIYIDILFNFALCLLNRFFSSRTQYNTTRNSFVVFRNITPSLQLTIYLSIRQPTYLSIYLSLHLSKLSLSFYLSIHLPIFLFVYHYICPLIYLLLSFKLLFLAIQHFCHTMPINSHASIENNFLSYRPKLFT